MYPCPVGLRECQQIIRTGHPGFDLAPVVAHSGNTLSRGDGNGDQSGPYLILFAGYIGAIDLESDSGQVMMLEAARQVPVDNRRSCMTLIMATASEAARRALEAKMETSAYRNDFFDSYVDMGVAKGRIQTLVSDVLEVLRVRGLALTKSRTEQVQACTDVDQLHAWHRAAVTAETADDVFGA